MKTDYLEASITGKGSGHLDIELRVNADHVEKFANEIKQATIDEMLEIIDRESDSVTTRKMRGEGYISVYKVLEEIRTALLAVKERVRDE